MVIQWQLRRDQPLPHQYATAPDGAKLSYYSIGRGPGVLVLHGAVCYALTHKELSVALSPYYTVHTASRRSRGLSAPYPAAITELNPYPETSVREEKLRVGSSTFEPTYSSAFKSAVLGTELADLEALVLATNAEYVISVSSGALVALNALLPSNLDRFPGLSRIKSAIIFEPPLFLRDRDSATDLSLLSRFEQETKAGDETGAMVTAMELVQLGPRLDPTVVDEVPERLDDELPGEEC